jgi:hypothetical protein
MSMETYYWKTLDYHNDNGETLSDYLDYHLPDDAEILTVDFSYAEIKKDGVIYEVHASGDGDSYNHKIEFFKLTKD